MGTAVVVDAMKDDPKRLEVLKVWYSVFCTLVDSHTAGESSDWAFMDKLLRLRHNLAEAVPEVEVEMARYKQ
jgi:hypothetical protein